MRATRAQGNITFDRSLGMDIGGSTFDRDDHDDSSIASSRPCSLSPGVGCQPDLDCDDQVFENETSMASDFRMRGNREEEKIGDEWPERQCADVQEMGSEPEPVPGLLSGRKPSFSSPMVETFINNGPVHDAHDGLNGAEIAASQNDGLSESQITDQILDKTTSHSRHASVETAQSTPEISGNNHVSSSSNNLVFIPLHTHAAPTPTQFLRRSDSIQSLVDPAHARPSLNMTAQEFSEAKAIILDLLGWGVPSEYLMSCGLARESIYYAFTELNLRLPDDFDTDGIVPYEPPSLPVPH